MRRIGIYGGSFAPPHNGHVRAAQAFLDAIEPDLLLIVPSARPPHKQLSDGASDADRLAMARLAFSDIGQAVVSDMEMVRGGVSYTADTLRSLAREGQELYLLVGTDMLLTLDRWYKPEVIFKLSHICYVRRENDAALTEQIKETVARYERSFGARIHAIPMDVLPLSSTEVRDGRVDADAVPPKVLAYMTERGLYGYGRHTDRA